MINNLWWDVYDPTNGGPMLRKNVWTCWFVMGTSREAREQKRPFERNPVFAKAKQKTTFWKKLPLCKSRRRPKCINMKNRRETQIRIWKRDLYFYSFFVIYNFYVSQSLCLLPLLEKSKSMRGYIYLECLLAMRGTCSKGTWHRQSHRDDQRSI